MTELQTQRTIEMCLALARHLLQLDDARAKAMTIEIAPHTSKAWLAKVSYEGMTNAQFGPTLERALEALMQSLADRVAARAEEARQLIRAYNERPGHES